MNVKDKYGIPSSLKPMIRTQNGEIEIDTE